MPTSPSGSTEPKTRKRSEELSISQDGLHLCFRKTDGKTTLCVYETGLAGQSVDLPEWAIAEIGRYWADWNLPRHQGEPYFPNILGREPTWVTS